ncbi:PucR family transcriptional regulator [Sulfobacillus sp. hq2]|uniref:PucR family transcriptional regulator n=1 Tax=Sulfobacillus sp. hq2 TaxID=2039167 RepID=UPI001304F4CC|nr:PucR family transcriptional regulator [Sulfobacillus sp. hq2]
MPLTIARLMKTPILKEARLVAGYDGINRMADSVNMMDAPDIVEWIRPQQILITTLYSVKDDRSVLNTLIPQLAERGCAALGIKPQRYLERVPAELYDQANQWGLPIIELPQQLPLGIISHEITRALLRRDDVDWNDDTQEKVFLEMTDIALRGHQGWEMVAQHLSQLWHASVGLLDNTRAIRAVAARGINNALFEMVAQQLRDRASYVRDGSPQGLVASGETAEGYPVIREGVWYGEIILVRRRKPLGMALSAAIHAIALLRAKQYWSMQQLYVQQRQWIEGMTREGSLTPVSTLTSPFRFDHVLFKGPYGAMVVHVQTGPGFQRMGNHWNQRVSLLDETAQWLQMFLTQKGWGLILASDDDELVGIASPGSKSMEGDDFSWNYRQLEEASQALWAHFHVKVSFHLGRLYPSASHLPLSLQEAREVAKTLTNHVINVYQARSLQALLRQIAPEDRARFVTEVFGPLLTLSEPERAVLLETMDIFFENQNQASEAAKALYVHRNTVLYRIRKLEDLLHRSLSDAEDLLTVRVALLFLKELDLREGAPRHDMY